MKVKEYVSEFEQFFGHLLDEHPEYVEDQRHGWDIWWDHKVNLEDERLARTDTVPTPPYYYH
ncbi:DUF3460 family protein [Pseudoduganella sp. RAF53_2]|jgi:hypothetical protein|uniref:DUF3460 family protein n=1 Tax=unclassified Pseudoduganella TaxID=2637179 RepID=UPI003F956DA2